MEEPTREAREEPVAGLLGLGTAVPPNRYTQEELLALSGYRSRAIQSIFRNSAIETRHLAVEPDHKLTNDPQWFADHYRNWAVRLGAEAARKALARAGVMASGVDYLVATSCTGYVCPGISLLLARELGLSNRAKTANLVGMGCSAALPALERASEFLARRPGGVALVVAVEVSSAAYWVNDADLESGVGNAIFSDGAAAAVVAAPGAPGAGRSEAGPRPILQFHHFATRTNRELIDYMGFTNDAGRLRVRLSRDLPEAVIPLAEQVVGDLLASAGRGRETVSRWVFHPGGKRILELAEARLGLAGQLGPSREVLRRYGNMSSATVLFVLEEHLKQRPGRGELGVLMSMGPGLTAEGALVRWT